MSESQVQQIIERLRGGRCVLCAGSRLGAAEGGGYRDLVAQLMTSVPNIDVSDVRRVLEVRPLAAAGFVRRRLGDQFAGALQKATASPGELPEAVQLLGQLPFRAVVTTSYGDLFERAFTRDGTAPRVYTPADSAELRRDGKGRFVFKALGDAARAETVVWSSEDLQGALADGAYRAMAQDLYRSRSFLFVGFDPKDPDFGVLLERVLSGARAGEGEHYAVLPELSEIEREELYAAYRIRVLPETDATQLARALKEALGDDPGLGLPDDDDLEGWLQLLAEDPSRADALDRLAALEGRLREAKDHDRLIELFLGRVDVAPEASGRAAMLLEVARIFENEVGDLAKAFTALLAGYKEDPRPEVWVELERLASATGLWTELLAELAEVVPALPDLERAQAWVRIALLYGDKLGHAEYALTSLDEALKIQPELGEAQEMRITLLRRAERWKDLADALWKRASQEDSPARLCELYCEQADVYESRLADGGQAISCYKQALEADPSSPEARASLEALLRRRGDHRELVALLDGKRAHVDAAEALALQREVAELLGEKLGDRKAAIERYEALRAESAHDLPTLRALERLYEQEGRHEQYLGALAAQAEAVESDRERAALYRRLGAEWEEQPGGATRAAEYLEKLLALDTRSEDALRSLERLYRADHNWEALIDVLRRHAAIVPAAIRGELFAQIGGIYEQELRDPAHAIEAYVDVETALPGHAEALVALTRLYEKGGAWAQAVETLERRAAGAEVRSQKVELFHRAGEITGERLGDAKAAEALFVRALELDSTHVPSMTALVEIYRRGGEFLRAAKLLVEAVPHTQNRLEKTRLLVEAGEIFEGLEDRRKATELYLEALTVDPEHVEAGERVAELLWHSERYQDLVPVLEMLSRKPGDPSVQIERLVRLARAAHALGLEEKVEKAYARAAEIDPGHLEAQRGRAELHFDRSEWAEALAALGQVLQHHGTSLPPSEQVELYYRLGACQLKLGDKEAARQRIEKALELDPTHRPSLLAMVEFGEAKPESVIDAKKALLLTANEEEKVKLLGEIGDLYLEKLEDPPQAVGAYREALELRSEDQRLLHKCLDVYVEQKHWTQALEMLERLIQVEKNAAIRSKYRNAAGLICRDELGRPEHAAKLLSESLDDDPALARSSEALEELLRDRQEWKELARFYRKALKRLGPEQGDGKNPERLRIWSALGELCLDKLGERESAIAALEVALSFDRGNLDRHRALADLYVQAGPDRFDKAIAEHQILLRADRGRVLSYRALKQLYLQTSQRDKAGACSYALAFLKKGEADDQKLVAELKARSYVPARRVLTDENWARLQHPDEDRFLQALFAVVAPALLAAQAQPHKQVGLSRKDALDANDPRPFAKAFRHAVATLAVPSVELYARPEQQEAATFQACIDKQLPTAALVLGQPLLQDKRPERELAFEMGRRAALLRPDRILRLLFPQPAAIAHVLDAAIALGAEGEGQSATAEVHKTLAGLKHALTPVQLEQVITIGRKLAADGITTEAAALAWLQASDLSAGRAGLVLAGDLETCARLLASEPASATTLTPTQRLLDLVWSSVTEEVFTVRKHLGLQ